MAGIGGAVFPGVIADRLVHHIPAVDDARELFLEMGHHLVDIAGQPGLQGFRVRNGLGLVIIFVEEPLGHIGVPDQHMAADPDAVLLRPGNHFVRSIVIHAGHAVFRFPGRLLVQEGVGLGFVCTGQGIEVAGQEFQEGPVVHILKTEGAAQFKSVGLRQGPERIVIRRDGAGCLRQAGQGKQADHQGKAQHKKAFHKRCSFFQR